MPMPKLDDLVLQNVKDRVLLPERLSRILEAIAQRRSQQDQAVADRRRFLETELAGTKQKLARLYRAIEDGVVDLDADLKARVQALKNERDIAQASLDRISEQSHNRAKITPERIEAFATLMREKLDAGDTQARKAYLRSVISLVEVDDGKVRIIGDKATLATVIAGGQAGLGNVPDTIRTCDLCLRRGLDPNYKTYISTRRR
jgi:site-specific DNA recombinase